MNLDLNNNSNLFSFKKENIIYKEGDLVKGFYIVLSGKVILLKNQNKRLVPLYTAINNDLIGEECVFSNSENYSCSAIAIEDCELVFIDKKDIDKFLNLKNNWIESILKSISNKILKTSSILAEHQIIENQLSQMDDFTLMENKFRELLK